MFDVGFSELMVIAVVALIVIGPERLPKVARTAGHLLGRLQRYVNDVKSDIHREMQLDELKKLQAEVQESARSMEHSVYQEVQALEQVGNETAQSMAEALMPVPLVVELSSPEQLDASPEAPIDPLKSAAVLADTPSDPAEKTAKATPQ
jgi:sec-independent protein translocase protein TatB